MKPEEILDSFNSSVKKVDDAKINQVLGKEKAIEEKRSKLNPVKFFMLFKQVKLAFEMLKDYKQKKYRSVPWKAIAMIVTALVYFLNPIDLIPDFLGVIGFTDDAIVLAFVFKSIRDELIKYCDWRGLNAEDYF
ncbi:MAG: YkvA family protein [Ignavibacteriota bacterium]|nr:YkvA family protein [Ignavibacteriota bacterium]